MRQRFHCVFLGFAAAVCLSSCATSEMIARAQGTPGPMDPPNQPPLPPNPAYYALVPLVFPFDLVAWPIQYFVMRESIETPG